MPCVRINGWVNNHGAGDLRRYCVHCDVIVMSNNYRNQCFFYLPIMRFSGNHTTKNFTANVVYIKHTDVCVWLEIGGRKYNGEHVVATWWRHQIDTFSALRALGVVNSPVTGEFPAQRPVTRSFDVFFDLDLNKQLSKQSRCWWFEMPSCPLWRHCNDIHGQNL